MNIDYDSDIAIYRTVTEERAIESGKLIPIIGTKDLKALKPEYEKGVFSVAYSSDESEFKDPSGMVTPLGEAIMTSLGENSYNHAFLKEKLKKHGNMYGIYHFYRDLYLAKLSKKLPDVASITAMKATVKINPYL